MKIKNKFLPILSLITAMTGPGLLVVACSHEISRYNAALSNDLQNRILFDFVGVNYSVNAKSQFSSAFKQGMEFIKKDVEGIMAQQEFFNFFVKKLNYNETKANETFIKVKDQIGLNILANDYFNTINSGQSFDSKVYTNKLIFQTENWHLNGTTRFNYSASEFYGKAENNPDTIFTPSYLYSNLDDETKDNKIKEVAKHADDNYNKEINNLTKGNPIWSSPNTPDQLPPTLQEGATGVQDYQKKLDRFKWWLRFRYQQYYYSKILPQLNETLFTMANVLNSILKITTDSSNQVKIQIDSSKYATQLQDWGPPSTAWTSKYRLVWDYTTTQTAAENFNRDWATKPLPDLMNSDGSGLNPAFLNRLASTDKTIKNTIDPILGINGFVSDTNAKDYNNTIKLNNISGWANNPDGTHYWGKNGKGSFAYSAPVYWIDVVQNLNFNFYNGTSSPTLTISGDNNLINRWSNGENSYLSSSNFSKYIRGDNILPNDEKYKNSQEMKWGIFWEMIYFLSSQEDTNSNKDTAKSNFTAAAKALYPKFIRKENIYNIDFWNAIKEYY